MATALMTFVITSQLFLLNIVGQRRAKDYSRLPSKDQPLGEKQL